MLGGAHALVEPPAAMDELTSAQAIDRNALRRPRERPRQHSCDVRERRDNAIGHIVEHRVNVGIGVAIVGVGPELRAVLRVGQMRSDTDASGRPPDRAADDEARAETLTDLADIERRVLDARRGLRGDERKTFEARQAGGDVFGQPRGKRHRIRVSSARGEGKDRDPERLGKPGGDAGIRPPHRARLDLLLHVPQLVIDIARRLDAIFRALLETAVDQS